MSKLRHCRPAAYELLERALPALHTADGLLRAATAPALHALDDADPGDVSARIDALAGRIRARLRSRNRQAVLAHLHEVLFDEVGLRGNESDYYNPHNSYLPLVLATGKGIPITLGLVYKLVAERVGLRVEGVNAPGHFLVRVVDEREMLIDAFAGGRLLTTDDAYGQMERIAGRAITRSPAYLQPATHRQWVSRMLSNLISVFAGDARPHDAAAMVELQDLLR